MTKYTRLTGKVFGSSATATGDDPEIGQFGSALAGTYNGTTDVSIIQSLPAWQKGFISAVTPNTQFPPLPEMTGFGKVLSQQICYLLQQGIAEYDNGTTYYEGNWCAYQKKLYFCINDNSGAGISEILPTNVTYWTQFTGGSSRNYGEIVTSSLPIIDDNTLHLADGSLLSASDYPEFLSFIANLYNSVPPQSFSVATLNANLGSNEWNAVAYGNRMFVAVGYGGKYSTSTDGTTWTTPATMVEGITEQTGVAYGNGMFMSITKGGAVMTSTDGTTWTNISTTDLGENFINITYGNGNFVVIRSTSLQAVVKYSSDGEHWSAISSDPYGTSFGGVCYDGEKFLVLSTAGYLSISDDLDTWTTVTTGFEGSYSDWADIIYTGIEYIAISMNGRVSTSKTGASNTWSSPTLDANLSNNMWTNMAYGNNEVVAIGYNGYISIKGVPYANAFLSEADWQATYTTYGECGKYVYNSGANTVRIPLYNTYLTNTVNPQKLGNLTEASIPNIKGVFPASENVYKSGTPTPEFGAFRQNTPNVVSGESSNTHFDNDLWDFDASRVSSVYSDTVTTVNTQSIKQLVYIVVAK